MKYVDCRVLFLVAHPDDLEIGAGGTAARLAAGGGEIRVVVCTDDHDLGVGRVRRQEALDGARALGLSDSQVHFLGLRDGELTCDRTSVAGLRSHLESIEFSPNIVVTHLANDRHNDHRAAHELATTAIRGAAVFLFMGVINSLPTPFRPNLFVDVSTTRRRKLAALRAHVSQLDDGRIWTEELDEFERKHATRLGLERVEPFEARIEDRHAALPLLSLLNDDPATRLWIPLIRDEEVVIVRSSPRIAGRYRYSLPSGAGQGDAENVADVTEFLRQTLHLTSPVEVIRSEENLVESELPDRHVVLVGGAVSNRMTRERFSKYRGIRYIIDYDMPGFVRIRIGDRKERTELFPDYESQSRRLATPLSDYGIVTIVPNPESRLRADCWLIAGMGVHGAGSRAAFESLMTPALVGRLLKVCGHPLESGGWQVIVRARTRPPFLDRIMEDTLHYVPDARQPSW